MKKLKDRKYFYKTYYLSSMIELATNRYHVCSGTTKIEYETYASFDQEQVRRNLLDTRSITHEFQIPSRLQMPGRPPYAAIFNVGLLNVTFTTPAEVGSIIYEIQSDANVGPISWSFTDYNNTDIQSRTIQGTTRGDTFDEYAPGQPGDQMEFTAER
jgi:hypothetical protein